MEKGRLFITEDDKIIALDLRNRLESFGYEVLGESARGAHAIARARELQPDLVLMDIFLKGDLDGIQTALLLRSELNIPVIFITAHSDDMTFQRAKVAEPFGYILKPFDDRDLRTVIEMGLYKAGAERRLRESEARYRAIVEDQTELIIRYRPDFILTFVNEAFCRFFECSCEAVIGKSYLEVASPNPEEDAYAGLSSYAPEHATRLYDQELRLPGERIRWVQWRAHAIFSGRSTLSEIQAVGRDITIAKQVEESLRESNERYYLAAEGANDGVWDWDLRSGRLFLSSRFKETLGYAADEIGDRLDDWFGLVNGEDLPAVKQAFSDHLAGHTPILHQECRLRRKDGTYGWFAVRGLAVCKPEHPPHRAAGSLTDITRQREFQEQLSYKAFHDSLTGLANRSLFLNRLQHALDRYRAPRKGLGAVLFLDLDFFKLVNDSLGHQAGDALLVSIARRLEEGLRPGDTLARFGGDEFAVLIEDVPTVGDGIEVARRIQQQLAVPFAIAGKSLHVTASIGVADTSGPDATPDSILHDVDMAMYLAKEKGRGRFEVFNPLAHQQLSVLRGRDNALDRAIQQNELTIYYQPVYSETGRAVVALEVLPLWNHPNYGLLEPHEFLDAVVDTALIGLVTRWILETVCRELAALRQDSGVQVYATLSLSLAQLSLANLPDLLQSTLEASGLPASCLHIQISERVASEHLELLPHVFGRVSALGISLSVSDFGSSYHFLSALERLQIRRLKLSRDRLEAGQGEEASERMRALVELGRSHHLEVTASQVDTPEQYRFFQSLGCDQFQGSLLGKPMLGNELRQFLQSPPAPLVSA